MNAAWYFRRARVMGPGEILRRGRDEAVARRWRRRAARGGSGQTRLEGRVRALTQPVALPASTPPHPADSSARRRLLATANGLRVGAWPVFGVTRTDLVPTPDWFLDPASGTRLPATACSFDVDLRDHSTGSALKPVWELSRHHHVTVLAAAYHYSGDERYAETAAGQLRSWWAANPFLTGVHWTSGIELGLRLISWVWTRRLLHGWVGAAALFEDNPVFLGQLLDHQEYLATFQSHGTSANNHLLAEAAGQFSAACGFPIFDDSARWRERAAAVLEREIIGQTFPGGHHRELASGYHAFALELGLVAALEGQASGHPLSDKAWSRLRAMADALASGLDARLRPPRQGDDDDGLALLVDAPGFDRIRSLLATGDAVFGRAGWWPSTTAGDVRTALWSALPGARRPVAAAIRPAGTDAGLSILRSDPGGEGELWCRLDHGPHGYLATAAHAHADALAVELRAGGVDILADPGTFCYQGNAEWRRQFRSTLGHNTLELDGVDQSVAAGPFLWSSHARTRLEHLSGADDGPVAEWRASHDGYRRLRPPARHRRTVRLERPERAVTIIDEVESAGSHEARLAFHLGPDVTCTLRGETARLEWEVDGTRRGATMLLAAGLRWRAVPGGPGSTLGWYSPAFGVRIPAVTLLGEGRLGSGARLVTTVRFAPATRAARAPEEAMMP